MVRYLPSQKADPPDDVRVPRLLNAHTDLLDDPTGQPVGSLGQLVDHAQRLLRHQHIVHLKNSFYYRF